MIPDKWKDKVSAGPGDCLTWSSESLNNAGYPNNGAHRQLYELEFGKGSIPEGHRLHHRCRRPSCVNVFHMIPVTHSQNVTFAHREKRGQMPRSSLRIARYFHNQMTERMRAAVRPEMP